MVDKDYHFESAKHASAALGFTILISYLLLSMVLNANNRVKTFRGRAPYLQNMFLRRVGKYGIRKALVEDLPSTISINWAALPEHYSDSFFEERLHESPETFLVVEDESGTIVGYIMCRIEYGFSHAKRYGLARKGHIVSVAILEGHRRMGLGRALVEESLKGMQERGCSEGYLEVRISNEPAIDLYRKLGFQTVSTHQGYYRDGESAYLMSKAL